MAFVLDASIAGPWILADEPSELARQAAHRLLTEDAVVPSLWWYEVRNLLVTCERRGRLAQSDSDLFLSQLKSYPITIDDRAEWDETTRLARKHKLTVYDASYLELAMRNKLSLATLDRALEAAARAEAVTLIR